MRYAEWAPPSEVANLVEACWRVDGQVGHALRVLADSCTDLIALDDRASRVLFVGPMTRADLTRLQAPTTVGLRLRPGVYVDVAGTGAGLRALRDRELVAANPHPTDDAAAGLLAFLGDSAERTHHHDLVDRLLALMRSRGPGRLADCYREVGVSERTAQRLFDTYVGLTPRQCSRVLRHIGVGRRLRSGVDSIAELAAEHGYADQPHLTRDFGALAGIQPARFVGESEDGGFVQDLLPEPGGP